MARFGSIDDIPLIPVEEFFKEHPDVTGYFGGFVTEDPIVTGTEFEKLLPLRTVSTPAFPEDVLPKTLGNFSNALAEYMQVPRAFVGPALLATISMCSLRKWKVQVTGQWSEYLPIWVIPLLKSGERKTPVLRELLEPVNDWLSEKEKATAVSRTGLETKKSVYEKRAETLRKAAAAADNEADLERLIKESAEFAAMAAEIEVPPEPKLYSGGDATSEGMAKELRKHGGRLSIMTDEGKQLSIIAGRYTADQAPDVELYLKATHGGIADSIRATSKTINVVDPEIAMLQCVQPTVLFNMRNSATLRGQGFFARCYPVLPESMIGYRTARPGDLDEEVRAAYHDLIKTILDVEEHEPRDHRLIRMSDEADRWVLHLQQWVEGRCAPGKAYSENLEWVSKFIGYTVRIAAYLKVAEWAAAEDRGGAEGLEIDAATMKSAIKVGFFFLEHAEAVFGVSGDKDKVADAMFLANILRSVPDLTIRRRDLQRKVHNEFEKVEEMMPALELLAARNYIRLRRVRSGEGGRPSIVIKINPALKLYRETTVDEYVPVTTSEKDPAGPFFEWAAGQGSPEDDPDNPTPEGPTKEKQNSVPVTMGLSVTKPPLTSPRCFRKGGCRSYPESTRPPRRSLRPSPRFWTSLVQTKLSDTRGSYTGGRT